MSAAPSASRPPRGTRTTSRGTRTTTRGTRTTSRGTRTTSRGTRTDARWVDLPRDGAEYRATFAAEFAAAAAAAVRLRGQVTGAGRAPVASTTTRGSRDHRAVGRPTARWWEYRVTGSEYRATPAEYRATRWEYRATRIEQGERD